MSGEQRPRDWDRELAQIDKLIASSGAPPGEPAPAPARGAASPAPPKGGGATARPPGPAVGPKRAVFLTWVRLLLGLLVGIAITQWPYQRGCGLLLFGYLAAVAGVIVAGLWSTVSSWRTRSGVAHVLSIGLMCWGALLAAREVLPRVGYAKASATWFCPAPRPATPPSPGAAPAATPSSPTQGVR